MNMSFSYTNVRNIPQITSAMRDAASAGRIMVASLGNCGSGRPQCSENGGFDDGIGPSGAPAANVADSGIAGFAIAVGSLDRSGTRRASHSNTCGPVARYCLFAPGESINTTRAGEGYDAVSGTSFAAPHVAGAAAVVWGAFPNKPADQIVQRLLTTARSLDGREISSTYGHGALDLGAALDPVGFLGLSVGGVGMVPLRESFVDLPPGFGVSGPRQALADAVVYDEQMFPFLTDLSTSFRAHKSRSSDEALADFMQSLGSSSSVLPLGRTTALELAYSSDVVTPGGWGSGAQEEELPNYRLHFQLSPGLTARIGQGFGSRGSSNHFVAQRMGQVLLQDGLSVGPFAAFAGRGQDLSIEWRQPEDDDTVLDLAAKEGQGYFGSTRAWLASVGLTRRIGEGMTVGTRYGRLWEHGSLLGIQAKGAFDGISSTTTSFLDVSVEKRVSGAFNLFGSYSHGTARGESVGAGSGSLVSGWSGAHASSLVLGGEITDLWLASDRLTFTAGLPFRARDAAVQVDVPDREVADGVVRYVRREVNIAPRGQERRLQLMYGFEGEGDMTVSMGGYMRIEPDHDRSAEPEFGAAAKMLVRF